MLPVLGCYKDNSQVDDTTTFVLSANKKEFQTSASENLKPAIRRVRY